MVRVSVVNFPYNRNATIESNLKTIEKFLKKASKHNVDLIVFPELTLVGGIANLYDKLNEIADVIPGKYSNKLCELSKRYSLYVIVGMPEKQNNKFYNSTILIDPKGEIIGVYRKTHLVPKLPYPTKAPPENKIFAYGNELPVFNTEIGKIAMTICYDYVFPEVYRTLSLKGAEIITISFWLNFNAYVPEDLWVSRIRVRAADNQVFILVSNYGFPNYGRSLIVNPFGYIIADTGIHEGIAIADIDIHTLREYLKEDHSLVFYKHRRPELYKL